MIKQKQCYLCKNKGHTQRPGSVRGNPALKVLECTACGLVFLSSCDHINDDLYKNSGMHGQEVMDIQTWSRETAWDDERRFGYLKPLIPDKSLLDFGCGTGGFLLLARTLAAKAHGVELEDRLKNHFKNHGLTVFHSLSEIPKDAGGYDIITLFHVLEHIPDPKSELIALSKNLTDDGQIIVEVPNAVDVLLTLYNNEPFSNFTYWSCHLFLFTVKTLRMLAFQAGLKINYIKHIQRYPLSNHLYWLSKGKPGGHKLWHFLDSLEIHTAYEKQLAAIGKCDTIIGSFSKQSNYKS